MPTNRNGLRWRDAPSAYGPHKTLFSRCKRWSEKGIFAELMAGLAAEHVEKKTVMIDATYLMAHRTTTSIGVKFGGLENSLEGCFPVPRRTGRERLIDRTKGGINTKLHAICDSQGRCLSLFVAAGQVSNYIGARTLLGSLPNVDRRLGDRGCHADWFRQALVDKGKRARTPGRKPRKQTLKYDKRRKNYATASRSCSVGSRIGGA